MNIINPDHRKLRDCRTRAPELKEKSLINTIVEDNHTSVRDARALEPLPLNSENEEIAAIKDGISTLLAALYGHTQNLPTGGLAQKLVNFSRNQSL